MKLNQKSKNHDNYCRFHFNFEKIKKKYQRHEIEPETLRERERDYEIPVRGDQEQYRWLRLLLGCFQSE